MKNISIIAGILFTTMLVSFKIADGINIGDTLPKADVKLKDVSGKEISLQEAKKEKGLLVMFSCNTCPFVIKNQERTNEICAYALKMNVGVVILNSNTAKRTEDDSYEAMKKYFTEQKYSWYYALDNDNIIADAFGAMRTPECYLFDKELKLVYHGAIDNNASDASQVTRKHLQVAIDEINSGKEISIKTSRSVGCTIKRKS
jgi:peroxiredoxin